MFYFKPVDISRPKESWLQNSNFVLGAALTPLGLYISTVLGLHLCKEANYKKNANLDNSLKSNEISLNINQARLE